MLHCLLCLLCYHARIVGEPPACCAGFRSTGSAAAAGPASPVALCVARVRRWRSLNLVALGSILQCRATASGPSITSLTCTKRRARSSRKTKYAVASALWDVLDHSALPPGQLWPSRPERPHPHEGGIERCRGDERRGKVLHGPARQPELADCQLGMPTSPLAQACQGQDLHIGVALRRCWVL